MKISRMRFLYFAMVLAVTAMAGGCSEQVERQQSMLTVRYQSVATERLVLSRDLPGRVSAFTVSEVRPQVSGIIQERLFEEGSDVVQGQPLYQIDPALFKAAVSDAQARVKTARLLAERYGRIVDKNAVSKQEHDDAVASYDMARANLETARINLGYTTITAPVSGRIGSSAVTPGALVTQNQATPLAIIQQLSPVYVDVTQSNTELLRLRRAFARGLLSSSGPNSAKVRLKLEDGSPYALERQGSEPVWIEGDLLFSDVTIDQSTGAVTIRARFDNPEHLLLPGMYVRAVLEEGVLEDAVLIPQKSLMRDSKGQPYVYVLNGDGRELAPERRVVKVDRNVGNAWLITEGLKPGEKLVVEGLQKIRPGQNVIGEADRQANQARGEGR